MPAYDPDTHTIRSFVRRSGRITRSQRQALTEHWPTYGIDYALTVPELPSGYEALKLEIGIGNGDALISMATDDPDSLYIGIEVHEPGVGRCLNQVEQRQLANVRLINHDAIEVLQHMIEPESLDRVLLFFPDPWHKKRHHKRRIVNPGFRDLLYKLLKPGGVVHIATDWQDYAEWIVEQFLADQRFTNLGDADGYAECPTYRPLTRFEQRGRRLGHGVWDLLFARTN
ncbi:MAG: tRNA (guanosine(46)-N7)-methyltransferase TrmB [Gammaproteobacteria bacterium]|nr:tRNA (guanosine(46)-N7)-methyltransferase TrmB [Gammaproteobacteria bacterium]